MKIINFVVVLMILVCGSQSSHGEKLDCLFEYWDYDNIGIFYSCYVISLVNPHNNLKIDGYSGEHLANKNDADIKAIWIHDTNTKYIPTNLGSLSNLTVLRLRNIQLVEINAKDFLGMQDLEEISFYNNNLTSVPLDAFATLTKLKIISLSSNEIEELPNGIFKNNLELEEIYLWKNKIKYLGTEIFNNLKKLVFVDLRYNICVNKEYRGTTEINQLKEDIKMKCKNPNEVPATTTTTTTTTTTPRTTTTSTTQNPMEVKLIEMQEKITKLEKELRESKEQQKKNEAELTNERESMKKQLRESKEQQQTNEDSLMKEMKDAKELLQKCETEAMKERVVKDEIIKMMLLTAFDVQQKDRVEIEKLRTALVEAKDTEKVKVFEVSNLKQDLLEAKQMNERIPKLERETYDLNKEIFNFKEQRRIERSAFIEVKGKLKRAEEQLASCEKDPAETLIDLRHSRNVNEI